MSKFHWDSETIEHFKIESALNALSGDRNFVETTHLSISEFVKSDCDLENDETYADLTIDLLEAVLTSKSNEWKKFHEAYHLDKTMQNQHE